MIHILYFVLYFSSSHVSCKVEGNPSILKEDLELERQLELINKPPIKSIHTKFGHIVDCIDIYKQPSFDHPLLKGHKLQRKPNFQNVTKEASRKTLGTRLMFGLGKDECPMGTVPILRTTKDDLIRENSLLNDHILLQDLPGVHVAEVSLKPNYGPYYGVGGINKINNPRVDTKLKISMSHLWVQNGPIESTNKISLGWHVIPQLYGDYGTHFYISWTSDNYKKTGCYNIRCAGFVQTNKEIYLGVRIVTISQYEGVAYVNTFALSQDPVTKNWWISIDNKFIGYFPAKLFSNMSSSDQVGWGGRTRTPPGTQSPQMGNGHFPHDNNPRHTCYFKQVWIQDNERKIHGAKVYETHSFTDSPNCYDVRYYGDTTLFGYILMFGGPGGNCGN